MNHYQPQDWYGQTQGPAQNPSTTEFGAPPPQMQGYGPPPRQGMSSPVVVLLTLGVVLLVGLLIAAAWLLVPRLTTTASGPETSTVSVTATATVPADSAGTTVQPARPAPSGPPSGAYECMGGSGRYGSAAVGSSVTSCEFAESVWAEYVGAGGSGQSMTVRAYSPVTGMTYSMSCSGGAVVTCTGGNNAVVHIY